MSDLTFFVNKFGGLFYFNYKTSEKLSMPTELEKKGCNYYFNELDAIKKASRNKFNKIDNEEYSPSLFFAFPFEEKKIKSLLKGFTSNRSFPFYVRFNAETIVGFNDQESFINFLGEFNNSNIDVENIENTYNAKILKK